ncbi:dihydropyrimidinase-like isoform X2 [Artemia franciscana]|uniref:dihydropyrimidinase-like isoform X2 n=1 Tax=Artemia franciscana TaxID=6661 RepID=UPI0032DB6737
MSSDNNNDSQMCIPGMGENKPRPRVLGTSFFGYVPDAFSNDGPDFPSAKATVSSASPLVNLSGPSPLPVPIATETLPDDINPDSTKFEANSRGTTEEAFNESAQNRLIIKNGKVVNSDSVEDVDIYVEDGIIRQVGNNLIIPGGARVIDARGRYVFPGGVDTHTHFQLPFMGTCSIDDFYSGTKAAIAGGTTTIMDFVIPQKGQSLIEAYNEWRNWADENACCDYNFHVAVTWWSEQVKEEMAELVRNHGVNSFKIFMAYKDVFQLNDKEIYEVFEWCKELGAIAQVHAENGDIIKENCQKLLAAGITGPEGHALSRPEDVEAEAVNRACVLANQVNCPIFIDNLTSKAATDIVATLRKQGHQIFSGPLSAALGITGLSQWDRDWKAAAALVCSPPLRVDPDTPDFFIERLAVNDLQTTGTDHCTFSSAQKALGKDDFTKIPNGVNGVEERLMLLWDRGVVTEKLTPSRFVAVTSTNAAKIFNLYPKKGVISVGSDADIVIWNPNKSKVISAQTHHSKCDFNIFEGMECHGAPEYVILGGRVVVDEEEMKVVQGYGQFVPTDPFPAYVYDTIKVREEDRKPKGVNRDGTSSGLGDVLPPQLKATVPANNGEASVPAITPEPKEQVSPTPQSPVPNGADYSTPTRSYHASHFTRAPTVSGGRNMQDTTFSLSSDYPSPADLEASGRRTAIKVRGPPGGQSTGLW